VLAAHARGSAQRTRLLIDVRHLAGVTALVAAWSARYLAL
jgi:hypothetical protein